MPAQTAQYEILIPKVDNLGNPLRDLAKYVHNHVASQLTIQAAHIDSGRRVFWEGREEPFDAFVFQAPDEPVSDSTAKQVASYIGEVTNQDVVLVSKHGKSGIQSWPIKNPNYQHGAPADPSVLQNAKGPHDGDPLNGYPGTAVSPTPSPAP